MLVTCITLSSLGAAYNTFGAVLLALRETGIMVAVYPVEMRLSSLVAQSLFNVIPALINIFACCLLTSKTCVRLSHRGVMVETPYRRDAFVNLGILFCGWIPYAFSSIYAIHHDDSHVYYVANCFLFTCYLVYPLAKIVLFRERRMLVKKMLPCWLSSSVQPIVEEEIKEMHYVSSCRSDNLRSEVGEESVRKSKEDSHGTVKSGHSTRKARSFRRKRTTQPLSQRGRHSEYEVTRERSFRRRRHVRSIRRSRSFSSRRGTSHSLRDENYRLPTPCSSADCSLVESIYFKPEIRAMLMNEELAHLGHSSSEYCDVENIDLAHTMIQDGFLHPGRCSSWSSGTSMGCLPEARKGSWFSHFSRSLRSSLSSGRSAASLRGPLYWRRSHSTSHLDQPCEKTSILRRRSSFDGFIGHNGWSNFAVDPQFLVWVLAMTTCCYSPVAPFTNMV